MHSFIDLQLSMYRECGISNNSIDMPYVGIERCAFLVIQHSRPSVHVFPVFLPEAILPGQYSVITDMALSWLSAIMAQSVTARRHRLIFTATISTVPAGGG